jgi:hypothetical protein
VELAGIPGAGKSRLARTVAEGLAERGVLVRQPQAALGPSVPTGRRLARKVVVAGAAASASPGTTARVVRALLASGQPGSADRAGRLVQWLVAQHVTARAGRRPGVGLVDEGVLQCLWSIGLRGDVEPVLRALAESPRAAVPDVLVVVQVAPEVALSRLGARASRHSRTQLLSEDEGLAELRRGEQLLVRLVDWFARESPAPVPVLTVSNGGDRAKPHESLVDQVCDLAARRGS